LLDRWNGDLGRGYRKSLGALNLPAGRVLVGEPGNLTHAETVTVPPGRYEVWLAVARLRKDERVSHAFLALSKRRATAVRPMSSATGDPMCIGVDGGLVAFASPGAVRSLAAASGGRVQGDHLLVEAMRKARPKWLRFPVPDSDDAVFAFSSGYGDGIYPLVTLHDDRGDLLAVAVDFRV
jgi:hypothetical protein